MQKLKVVCVDSWKNILTGMFDRNKLLTFALNISDFHVGTSQRQSLKALYIPELSSPHDRCPSLEVNNIRVGSKG